MSFNQLFPNFFLLGTSLFFKKIFARTEHFANLIASEKKIPKVLFNTVKNIVSPDIPCVPIYTSLDVMDFLINFVNKVAAIRSDISTSSSQCHTCSYF